MFEKLREAFSLVYEKVAYSEFSEEELDQIGDELLFALAENDVAVEVAESIVNMVKEKLKGTKVRRTEDKKAVFREKLREVLLEIVTPPTSIDLLELAQRKREQGEPLIVLFLGPNGHGKTTTIAKIALWFKKHGFKPVIAASDTFRAGAIEQLEEHARHIGVPVIKQRYGADPAAVAYDAVNYARKRGYDVVLIDTAGRLQTNVNLMEELKKISRVVKPDVKIFVGDALTGNDALEMARMFDREVGIDASILTKVDADARGGAAISIAYATGKPLVFLGTGQDYEDLVPFSPKWLIDRILGVNA